MTVKELIAILNTLPSDATVIYAADRFVADEVVYDEYDNTVTFAGTDEFNDIPDDVDESNYDPYMGCDYYECDSIDEGW